MKKTIQHIMLITILVVLALSACTPGATTSPDVSVTPTPITSPVPDRATATQRPTATMRPTETETPYEFEVTLEKLNHIPPDYQYLLDHPDEFVKAINPRDYGMDVFNQWIDEELDPVLGERQQRQVSVMIEGADSGPEEDSLRGVEKPRQLMVNNMQFFYFVNYGVVHPVYIINGLDEDGGIRTMAVALADNVGAPLEETMEEIYRRDQYFDTARILHVPNPYLTDNVNDLILGGFTGFSQPSTRNPRTKVGFGYIHFALNP